MNSRPEELERFKTEIDLRYLAADFGYQISHRESSASGTVMRGVDGSKIRVTRGTDGHYVYWNAHDDLDSGSVVDFIQKRTGANLGQVRKQLRPWIGGGWNPHRPPPLSCELPELVPIARDLAAVQAQVDGMARLVRGQHRYLNDRRGIPAETIAHPRFCERVRVDDRGNAAFIHINRDGVSGFELKNYKFTGFSKAGAKGLFASACYPDDHCLVFGEAAIDVLSYATLEGLDRTRFVSLSGQPSPAQLELARAAMLKQPSGEVVLAFDNDEGGDKLGDRFMEMFGEVGRDDLSLRLHRPETRGFDWNEELNTAQPEQEPPSPT